MFVIEGFDFGVGMKLPVVGRTEAERGAVVTTHGPVWDGVCMAILLTHGAILLSLESTGEIRDRAHAVGIRTGLAATVLADQSWNYWVFGKRVGVEHTAEAGVGSLDGVPVG